MLKATGVPPVVTRDDSDWPPAEVPRADAGCECQWAKDMAEVFTALQVVDNNAPGSVGGGGIGRQPPAPPVGN